MGAVSGEGRDDDRKRGGISQRHLVEQVKDGGRAATGGKQLQEAVGEEQAGGAAEEAGAGSADVGVENGAVGCILGFGALLDEGQVKVLLHRKPQGVHEHEDIGGRTRRALRAEFAVVVTDFEDVFLRGRIVRERDG